MLPGEGSYTIVHHGQFLEGKGVLLKKGTTKVAIRRWLNIDCEDPYFIRRSEIVGFMLHVVVWCTCKLCYTQYNLLFSSIGFHTRFTAKQYFRTKQDQVLSRGRKVLMKCVSKSVEMGSILQFSKSSTCSLPIIINDCFIQESVKSSFEIDWVQALHVHPYQTTPSPLSCCTRCGNNILEKFWNRCYPRNSSKRWGGIHDMPQPRQRPGIKFLTPVQEYLQVPQELLRGSATTFSE